MTAYFVYPVVFLVLLCLAAVLTDTFLELWEDCDDDEIIELEKYRANDDTN
jgi:hypothetical protein